jgi:hypothetical protein
MPSPVLTSDSQAAQTAPRVVERDHVAVNFVISVFFSVFAIVTGAIVLGLQR